MVRSAGGNPRFNISSRLANLPKLSEISKTISHANLTATTPNCAVCGRGLKNSKEFNQNVQVCGGCLNIYGKVEALLNHHAEQKAIEARRQQFFERNKGSK